MSGLDPQARAALDAFRAAATPSADTRARVRAALDARLHAPPATRRPPPVPAWSRLARLGPRLAVALLALAALVPLVHRARREPPPVAHAAVPTARVAPPAIAPAAPLAPAPRTVTAPDTAPTASAVVAPIPTARARPRPAPATDADALADELLALHRAQNALRDGHAALALATLDAFARTHPGANGPLAPERAGARVLALCALGRRDDAARAARAFLRAAPQSPLASRVRGCLDADATRATSTGGAPPTIP